MRFMRLKAITNKEKARMYFGAVNEYNEATVSQMVDENYIQHNPFVATGRSAFLSLLPKLKQYQSKIKNIRMLSDDSYIVMHHMWRNATPFGSDHMVAFHIIRFNNRGLIAEHWNVSMPNTASNPSGRSLIDGKTEIVDLDKTKINKDLVSNLMNQLIKNENFKKIISNYFSLDFHQHHPLIGDGVKNLVNALESKRIKLQYQKLHRVFGEGNFVLAISEAYYQDKLSAIYDLFRIGGEKVVEHWVVYQDIPTYNLANTNTMFNFV